MKWDDPLEIFLETTKESETVPRYNFFSFGPQLKTSSVNNMKVEKRFLKKSIIFACLKCDVIDA